MTQLDEAFSSSYAQARTRFLSAVRDAGLEAERKLHPKRGRDGEELAMDVARDGSMDASRLLIVSSACHGVEGFCGSGVQVAMLRDAAWRKYAADRGVAVLYVHALNPHGFSWLRRVTHENVDLNRNFHDFSKPLPANPGYAQLHDLMLPGQWPPTEENAAGLAQWVASHGEQAYQAAVTAGQHDYPQGMFFGGREATWSNFALREVLRAHGRRASGIAWIDIHTGLGPSGVGERIFADRNNPASLARARAWWDGGGRTPVTSIYDGSSTSAFLTGLMCYAVGDECPMAEYTGIAMEYGTVPVMQTLHALRGAHWLSLHPEAPAQQAEAIGQQMKDAFYTDTPEWKAQVVRQASEAMRQAVDGLSAVH